MLWVEKYRPQEFSEVAGLPKEIPTSLNNLPHFLFIGKPGTGKTTTAKIIVKKLGADCLTLNASDERGIQTIREKVKTFAMTKSSDGKLKIVWLDEIDALTPDAQNSLRNMMEVYHNNCRFIGTGNYENKISDALKSRFTVFKFDISESDIMRYISGVAIKELVPISSDLMVELVKRNKGDIRKCVNQLQRLNELGRNITEEDLNKESMLPEIIHETLKKSDFIKARQLLLDSAVEYDSFLEEYHEYIVDLCIVKKIMSPQQFANLVNLLAEAISRMNVISKEIIVENFLLKAMVVLKNG